MLSLSRSNQAKEVAGATSDRHSPSAGKVAATEATEVAEVAARCIAGLALARGSQTLLLNAIAELSLASRSNNEEQSSSIQSMKPLVEKLEEILSRRIMEITHPIENGMSSSFSFFFFFSLLLSSSPPLSLPLPLSLSLPLPLLLLC